MLEITGPLIGFELIPSNEGDTHLTIAAVFGQAIPIAGPQGMQLAQVPATVVRLSLPKKLAIEKAEEILAQAEELDDPPATSDIFVPGSPADVNRVANQIGQFRGSS